MIIFRLLVLLAVMFLSNMLFGGQNADTAGVRLLVDRGNEFRKKGQYDSAIVMFDSSAILFRSAEIVDEFVNMKIKKAESLTEKGNFEKALEAVRISSEMQQLLLKDYSLVEARRLVMTGSILRQQGKYDSVFIIGSEAQNILRSSPSISAEIEWEISTLFGAAYFNTGIHDSALAVYRRALQLFTVPDDEQQLKISATINSIAGIHETRGDYPQALVYFTESLELRRKILGEKHPDIANLYNNIAAIHFRTGDYDLSLEYYLRSLSIMTGLLETDHPSFGVRYNNIAMTYRAKKDFDNALDYGERSRAIFVKKLGEKHPNVAGVVNNIGRIYFDMKQYPKALESYQSALFIWKEKFGEQHPNVLQSYFNIGETYGTTGEFENAKSWLERSLVLRREMLGEKNVKVAQSYNALGTVYREWGKTDSSLQYFQRGICALVDGMSDTNIRANPAVIKSSSDPDLFAALTGKANGLFRRGSAKKDTADLKISLDTYEHAVRVAENIRRGFGSEGSKLQLSRSAFDVYERAIGVALALVDRTGDETYKSAVLSYAERSKSGILFDALSELNAQQYSGIPDSLLKEESLLRIDMTFNETQLQKEKDKKGNANSKNILRYQNTLFTLKRRYEQLIATFEQSYPDYFSLKHQSRTVTLQTVREQLPDSRTGLIEYVVGDSVVTIVAVTKERCNVISKRIPGLTERVRLFRNSIQHIESEQYLRSAAELYAELIAPVRLSIKGIKKLIIVPDGILYYLPFEALLTKSQSPSVQIDFSTLPYMIRQFEISYRTSAGSLRKDSTNGDGDPGRSFLGIAPVFADRPSHANAVYAAPADRVVRSRTIDGERFTELKETENEIKSIYDLFDAKHYPVKMALHNDAKESVLTSTAAGSYNFIHIASHGLINEEKPELSGIIFAQPEKRSSDDGILYAGEIYNLRLNADLVVLSACETGLGPIVKGEGMMGMTRGFMYAGARNLMVSLWQVGDRSTAELMMLCYRNILNKQSFSAALRNAKLTLIKKKTYAHPVEWSPFILNSR